MKPFVVISLMALAVSVCAQTLVEPEQSLRDAERQRISVERERVEAAFTTEEIACHQKFFVNSCLNEIKPRRRQTIESLRRQEVVLDDTERKLKGAEQFTKIQEKASIQKQQEAERIPAAQDAVNSRIERSRQKADESIQNARDRAEQSSRTAEKLKSSAAKAQARASRQAKAAANAEKFRQRQEEAQQRRAEHAQRAKGQGGGKPLPRPLPN